MKDNFTAKQVWKATDFPTSTQQTTGISENVMYHLIFKQRSIV